MSKQKMNPGGLVLVPFPPQGHLTPMLQLASILHSKGFSITIAHTQFKSPDSTNHPNFTFLTIPDDLTKSKVSSMNPIALIRFINDNLGANLPRLLGSDNTHENPTACIIYDAFMYKTESVANQLGIPSVILRSTSCTLSLVDYMFPSLLANGIVPLKGKDSIGKAENDLTDKGSNSAIWVTTDSMRDDLVPGLEAVRFKDIPDLDYPDQDDLLQLVRDTSDVRTSSAIIWNTSSFLEESSLIKIRQLVHVPCYAIGPFHKITPPVSTSLLEENIDCISWLDKQVDKSVIYVSFGSAAKIDEQGLIKLAWGLANSELPFLWVVRPGSVANIEWKASLHQSIKDVIAKGGGCIVEWAPQKEVLRHAAVGGFLSHCGWNSVLECVSEGVPMICRPCFGEQKLNARYVTDVWRVGIALENDELERSEIMQAARRLIVEKEGEEIRQRAVEYKSKMDLALASNGCSDKALNDLLEFFVAL